MINSTRNKSTQRVPHQIGLDPDVVPLDSVQKQLLKPYEIIRGQIHHQDHHMKMKKCLNHMKVKKCLKRGVAVSKAPPSDSSSRSSYENKEMP